MQLKYLPFPSNIDHPCLQTSPVTRNTATNQNDLNNAASSFSRTCQSAKLVDALFPIATHEISPINDQGDTFES
jgi:hypothetical protein